MTRPWTGNEAGAFDGDAELCGEWPGNPWGVGVCGASSAAVIACATGILERTHRLDRGARESSSQLT